MRQLFVWHALHGYWGGVAPTAPGGLALRHGVAMVDVVPSPGLLEVEPSMAWDPVTLGGVGLVEPADCDAFYEALPSGLRAAGVDGVKVDGQARCTQPAHLVHPPAHPPPRSRRRSSPRWARGVAAPLRSAGSCTER